jgi:hypothetical protein
MPYKSAAQIRIDELQEQLLERDRQLAELTTAKAAAAVDEATKKIEADKAAAIEAEKEAARREAWRWANFEKFAAERPNDQLDFVAIDHIPEQGWPSLEAEAEWQSGHPTESAAIAAVSSAAVSETALGKMVAEMEASRARLANT